VDQEQRIKKGTVMSTKEFVETATVSAPGRGTSIAQLRRVYQRDHEPISRTAFLLALADAGFTILVENEHTFLVGRVLAVTSVSTVAQNGSKEGDPIRVG
jgi:hypothetical protein